MTVCDHLVMTSFVNLIFLYVPHSELNRGVWDIALQKQRTLFRCNCLKCVGKIPAGVRREDSYFDVFRANMYQLQQT
jgi:hypothetical protein